VTIKAKMDLRNNKWSLRVAEGNVANLIFPPGDQDKLRIAIAKLTTGTGYDIQLNQPRLGVSANERYLLKFRARADRLRPVSVGFAKAGTPWTNLGLYKRLDLTPDWQEFQEEFNAVADEDNGRIHFDLGESDAAVELSSITLSKIAEHETSAGGSPDLRPTEKVRQISVADKIVPQRTQTAMTARATVNDTIEPSVFLNETKLMAPASLDWGWDRGLPIDRYYIERFLSSHADDIRGRVLEISDDWYTKKFGAGRPTSVDILDIKKENPRATVIADLTHADHIPSKTFDCIILPQTLQYIYEVRSAIGSLHRILKDDGVLLATFPATTRTRIDDPSGPWYWIFTTNSAQRLFEEMFRAESITISSYGNLVTATSFLRGLASEELRQEELDYCDANYQLLVCLRAVKS
jgi:SAM-dependent methyltransferase